MSAPVSMLGYFSKEKGCHVPGSNVRQPVLNHQTLSSNPPYNRFWGIKYRPVTREDTIQLDPSPVVIDLPQFPTV